VIRARFWRVPAAEIPAEPGDRARWLFEHWQRVDAFVGAELAAQEVAARSRPVA
jgi:hypothetical protein